tara:strand:+ start:359 stop:511 length:153 start_codon:yes stop_codon:yes gene_type:complete
VLGEDFQNIFITRGSNLSNADKERKKRFFMSRNKKSRKDGREGFDRNDEI